MRGPSETSSGRSRWIPREVTTEEMGIRERLIPSMPPGGRVWMPLLAGLLGAKKGRLTVTGVRTAAPGDLEDGCYVALGSDGGRAVAALAPGLSRALVDLGIGRPTTKAGGALTSGEEGVLLHVLDRAGGDWTRAGGRGFSLKGVLDGPGQAEAFLGGGDLVVVCGRLLLGEDDFSIWLVLSGDVAAAPAFQGGAEPGRAAGWPVRYRIVIGRSFLLASAAKSLVPGDVLTLDRWAHPEWGSGVDGELECGGDLLAARWVDRDRLELVLSTLENEKMEERDTEQRFVLHETRSGATREMEVVVKVVAGELEMSVEEALALVPGRVIVLDKPVGSTVSLIAGGRTIARGELVSHEGRMAVEITEVP